MEDKTPTGCSTEGTFQEACDICLARAAELMKEAEIAREWKDAAGHVGCLRAASELTLMAMKLRDEGLNRMSEFLAAYHEFYTEKHGLEDA